MATAINFLGETSMIDNIHTIGCTGGGSHKYAKEFSEQLGTMCVIFIYNITVTIYK